MKTFWMDLETYSECPISHGSHAYAAHPSTRILLWAYAEDDGPVKVWDCDENPVMPSDLAKAIAEIQSMKARHVWHNGINFDTVVLAHQGYRLPLHHCDDVMVMAYQAALPGSLEQLGQVFRLEEDKAKIKDGRRLILWFCSPKLDKHGCKYRVLGTDRPEDWKKFKEYCARDVEAMRQIYKRIPKFNCTEAEKTFQLFDAEVNNRGMAVDLDLARSAIALAKENKDRIDAETRRLTGGEVETATQTAALKDFISKRFKMDLDSLTKGEIEKLANDSTLPEQLRALLTCRLRGAKTSVAKYQRVVDGTTDGRLRGCLQFRGASRTGRFCLTGDHEVLTPTGWVRLDEWKGGRIAVWNKESEAISFQDSEALEFDYAGLMYRYDSVRCAQISTPDHRMPYMTKSDRWEVDTVENLAKRPSLRIPYTGLRKAPATNEHDLLRVLIMTQADGRYTEDGQVVFSFKKERKVQRCKQLLRRVGIPFTFDKWDTGVVRIGIRSRDVPLWLRLFRGKEYGYWLLNESSDIIFDELPEWDGNRCGPNSIQYCTKVKRNADLIQALAVLSGRTATMLVKKPEKEHWSDCYVVNIWSTPGKAHTLLRPTTLDFDGKVYCASTPTGFFVVRREGRVWITGNSGRVFQPQNLPRPSLSNEEIEAAIEAMKAGCLDLFYDDYSGVLSDALRGLIVAPKGSKLCVADYSNVEGRVLAWLAGETWKLQAFRDFDEGHGHDLYKVTYGRTFGVAPEDVTKKQRQVGKVEELALGYGGGAGAFAQFALLYGIDLDNMSREVKKAADPRIWMDSVGMWGWAKTKGMTAGLSEEQWIACNTVKQAWRNANPHIVKFWDSCETAVRGAIENPGEKFYIRKDMYALRRGSWLVIRLPSGRFLSYPSPDISEDGVITYYGVNQYTRKWGKLKTFNGKICENVTQATACDLLLEAGLRLEKAGFKVVLSVHDEYIAEVPDDGKHNYKEMEKIMSELPAWAEGLPLVAAGFESYRYRK